RPAPFRSGPVRRVVRVLRCHQVLAGAAPLLRHQNLLVATAPLIFGRKKAPPGQRGVLTQGLCSLTERVRSQRNGRCFHQLRRLVEDHRPPSFVSEKASQTASSTGSARNDTGSTAGSRTP